MPLCHVLPSSSPSARPAVAFLKFCCISLSFPLSPSPVILCLSVSDLVLDSLSYTHTHTHNHKHTKPLFPQVLKILENWLNFDVVFLRSRDVWNFDLCGWNWSRSWNSTFRQYCSWLAVFYSHHALWLTLFSSLLFSSSLLHLRLLFVLVVVWCRAVLACCPRPDQNTQAHTHTHTQTQRHTIQNKDTSAHTHTACSVSSNIIPDTFGLLVFSHHGWKHAGFCVGGLFKGEDSDVTKEPQLQLQHMLSEKFQPSGQSLFIARRKQ